MTPSERNELEHILNSRVLVKYMRATNEIKGCEQRAKPGQNQRRKNRFEWLKLGNTENIEHDVEISDWKDCKEVKKFSLAMQESQSNVEEQLLTLENNKESIRDETFTKRRTNESREELTHNSPEHKIRLNQEMPGRLKEPEQEHSDDGKQETCFIQ